MNPDFEQQLFDVAIVGGGMVGSSLALALSSLPLKVVVIDPYAQDSVEAPAFDARAIALSWGSTRIFNSLGIWQQLKSLATPIKKIHVSDRGHPGISRLNAKQFNVAAMGQVVELQPVGQIMHQQLQQSDINFLCPAKVVHIEQETDASCLTVDSEQSGQQQIRARLVVAADGKDSAICKMSGIELEEKTYEQQAIISTIQTQLPHNNVAFERFTETGPVAFLPLSRNRISLVWMTNSEQAKHLMQTTDADFMQRLQTQFGQRLGSITRIGERHCYALSLLRANSCINRRLVVVGNAAQSLHPIAGQGFNLGLRDVAALADIMREACIAGRDVADPELLQRYQQSRADDRKRVMGFTDTLARLFANPAMIFCLPRNIMLMSMNLLPQMRTSLAEAAMGISGKQSRLARGLSLELDKS